MAADNKPTTNTTGQAIQDIYSYLQDVDRRTAALAGQVQRIHRTVKLDEKEFAVGQQQSQREILLGVSALTETVHALARATNIEGAVESDSQALYWEHKERRSREVRKNIEHIRTLASCTVKVSGRTCPCGEHHGLSFVKNGVVVEGNLCPKTWWIKQSRLALEEGKLGEFVKSVPFEQYNLAYKIARKP